MDLLNPASNDLLAEKFLASGGRSSLGLERADLESQSAGDRSFSLTHLKFRSAGSLIDTLTALSQTTISTEGNVGY